MGMRIEFLPVYFWIACVLLVGGLSGLDYVQDRLEAQSGAVVKRDRLGKTVRGIWDGAPDALDDERASQIAARLRELADVTKEDKERHVERIKARIAN